MNKAAMERERREAKKAERCALAKCPLAGQGDARCAECTGPIAWKDAKGRWRSFGNGMIHRSCTSCPMDGKNLPVCFAGCAGPQTDGVTTDGQSLVWIGAMADADALIRDNALDLAAPSPRADQTTRLGAEAEAAVARLVRTFAELNLAQVKVIHTMLTANAKGGTEVAKLLGVSKQAVSKTMRRLVRKFPELRPFLQIRE